MTLQTPFEIALYLIANLFRVFVLFRFVRCVFEKKNFDERTEILLYFAYYILNSVCFLLIHSQIVNLITNIVPLILLTMLRRGKWPIRILAITGIQAAGMIYDSLLLSLEAVIDMKSVFIDSGAATSVATFSTVLILERLIGTDKHKDIHFAYTAAIVSIPLLTIIVGLFTMSYAQYEAVPQYVIIECAVLLLINGIVFVLFDVLNRSHQQELDQMHLREQNRAYLHQIELVEQEQNKVRYLRHDIKNHLNHIRELAKNESCSEIISYIDEALGTMIRSGTRCDSGNPVADSILNLKLSEAEAIKAEIHTEITIPKELPISAYDFNIILGNLLDNSIEAMKQCERKVLYIKLKYAAGSFCILIRNTYNEKALNRKAGDGHGLGLRSVRSVIEKYNGALDIAKSNGVYSVSALLCVSMN